MKNMTNKILIILLLILCVIAIIVIVKNTKDENTKIANSNSNTVSTPESETNTTNTEIDNTEKMVEDLVQKYKIDGIECYYSTFSEEQTKTVVEICNKYNLFCSGGSDFHGIPKPDTGIGIGKGSLRIEKKYIENWIKNISNIID